MVRRAASLLAQVHTMRSVENPFRFDPVGKLMLSTEYDMRQTLPPQRPKTRYCLLRRMAPPLGLRSTVKAPPLAEPQLPVLLLQLPPPPAAPLQQRAPTAAARPPSRPAPRSVTQGAVLSTPPMACPQHVALLQMMHGARRTARCGSGWIWTR